MKRLKQLLERSLPSPEMPKQNRAIQLITILVFLLMMVLAGLIGQYKIDLYKIDNGQRVVMAKMTLFEILFQKNLGR